MYKKVLLLAVAVFTAVTFSSCNKDDDNDNDKKEMLIGSWKPTKSEGYSIDDQGNKSDEYVNTSFTETEILTVAKDGSCSIFLSAGPMSGSITATWSYSNNKISVSVLGGIYSLEMNVISLTNTEMTLEYTIEGEYNKTTFQKL